MRVKSSLGRRWEWNCNILRLWTWVFILWRISLAHEGMKLNWSMIHEYIWKDWFRKKDMRYFREIWYLEAFLPQEPRPVKSKGLHKNYFPLQWNLIRLLVCSRVWSSLNSNIIRNISWINPSKWCRIW